MQTCGVVGYGGKITVWLHDICCVVAFFLKSFSGAYVTVSKSSVKTGKHKQQEKSVKLTEDCLNSDKSVTLALCWGYFRLSHSFKMA